MCHLWMRRIIVGSALWVALAPGVQAQVSDLAATTYSGVAMPVGRFADYASVGLTGGIQVGLPVLDAVDVVVRGELDQLNGGAPGMPDLRLWRYQAGVEAELLGQADESWGVRGSLGVGATSARSGGFYVPGDPASHAFDQTAITGTAGLELIFGASSQIHGYLGARLHWMPMNEDDTGVLGSAALTGPLDPLSSALSVPVTLGLRVRTS